MAEKNDINKPSDFSKLEREGKAYRIMKKEGDEDINFGVPTIVIDMDNYKPYKNNVELIANARAFLNTLKNKEFALGENNPNLKFEFSGRSVDHMLWKGGLHKFIITKQLTEIFKQSSIIRVENPKDEDKDNVEGVIVAGCFILVESKLYEYRFYIKKYKNKQTYIHSGNIDIELPENDKTDSDKVG